MKEVLKQLAAYNIWANQRLIEVIMSLPEEKQKQEVPSSFKSLYATLLHMWHAENIWWRRMQTNQGNIVPDENSGGNPRDLSNALMQQNRQWKDWTDKAADPMFEHVLQYHNTKKEYFEQPVHEVILHVFNHGTYHRGQLINILRQLGVEKIPSTDFILWSRMK